MFEENDGLLLHKFILDCVVFSNDILCHTVAHRKKKRRKKTSMQGRVCLTYTFYTNTFVRAFHVTLVGSSSIQSSSYGIEYLNSKMTI
jgi:hypothetical protein